MGPSLIGSWAVSAASAAFIPLAFGGPWTSMAMLMAAQLFGDTFGTAAIIYGKTVRQSVLPVDALGRVGGAFASGAGVAAVVGALVGGALGGLIGMRPTLLLVVGGLLLSTAPLVFSPLRRIREV